MKQLDLKLHPFVVMKNGQRVAFFSNLDCAADTVFRRPSKADSVVHLPSGDIWERQECAVISQRRTVMGLAA